MTTLENVVDAFETYAINHRQINGFGFGPINKLNSSELQFPLIWLHEIPSNSTNSLTTLSFEVYIIDLEEQGQDWRVLKQIQSNMRIIGQDTISQFWTDIDDELGFDLDEENVQYSPFSGKFDHYTAGYIQTINIKYINEINCSNIPVD